MRVSVNQRVYVKQATQEPWHASRAMLASSRPTRETVRALSANPTHIHQLRASVYQRVCVMLATQEPRHVLCVMLANTRASRVLTHAQTDLPASTQQASAQLATCVCSVRQTLFLRQAAQSVSVMLDVREPLRVLRVRRASTNRRQALPSVPFAMHLPR